MQPAHSWLNTLRGVPPNCRHAAEWVHARPASAGPGQSLRGVRAAAARSLIRLAPGRAVPLTSRPAPEVPPPLARAVAREVIDALGLEPTRPSTSISLGDTALLRLGLAEAASFWEIPNPIGRRDRKSGAKKRKQAEIEALNALNSGLKLEDCVTRECEAV